MLQPQNGTAYSPPTSRLVNLRSLEPIQELLSNGDVIMIRIAIAEDSEAINRLTQRAFLEYHGKLDPPNGSELEDPIAVARQLELGAALIAERDGRMVGAIRIQLLEHAMYVGRVAVDPDLRRLGIARRLMLRAEEACRRAGYGLIQLGTREKLKSNVDLYLGLGYEVLRVQKHHGGPDMVVIFTKRIDADESKDASGGHHS